MKHIVDEIVIKILRIECGIKKWGVVRKFLIESLKKIEINENINIDINKSIIPCEEIYINICRYAYSDGKGTVDIKCGYVPAFKKIFFEFIDNGIEFDPTRANKRKPDLPLDKVKAGGLGILISEKLSDEMKYRRINDKNILRISNYVKEC